MIIFYRAYGCQDTVVAEDIENESCRLYYTGYNNLIRKTQIRSANAEFVATATWDKDQPINPVYLIEKIDYDHCL